MGVGVSHHLFTQGPLYMYTSNNVIHLAGSPRAVPLFSADQEHDFTTKRHSQVTSVCGNPRSILLALSFQSFLQPIDFLWLQENNLYLNLRISHKSLSPPEWGDDCS